jgi:hypothetical protein
LTVAANIVVLVVGFVLTTVVGGLLGAHFQRRTWDHQHEAQLREKELERAADVCMSVSGLLDRRLYRMTRLQAAMSRCGEGDLTMEDVAARMRDYDQVLFEWNDALNGHRAVVGTYFGEAARQFLEDQIYESFSASGACLERTYRSVREGAALSDGADCGLAALNDLCYRLVSNMTSQIRDGDVGRFAIDATSTRPAL